MHQESVPKLSMHTFKKIIFASVPWRSPYCMQINIVVFVTFRDVAQCYWESHRNFSNVVNNQIQVSIHILRKIRQSIYVLAIDVLIYMMLLLIGTKHRLFSHELHFSMITLNLISLMLCLFGCNKYACTHNETNTSWYLHLFLVVSSSSKLTSLIKGTCQTLQFPNLPSSEDYIFSDE